MKKFPDNFHISFDAFPDYLPALICAIIVFIITIFPANVPGKIVSNYSLRRTAQTPIFISTLATVKKPECKGYKFSG